MYTPTLVGTYFNIHGKKPSKVMISAGAMRPILGKVSKGFYTNKSSNTFKMPKIGKLNLKKKRR